MADIPSTSSNNGEPEFKYIKDFDFLFKQLPSSSSTCEIVNVQPLDQSVFQFKGDGSTREMRSRQHLHYQLIQTFNDSNEFDTWWNHGGNAIGWIFNTIYKKKTDDEVHVYRCGHRNCSQRLRVVFVARCCDVRVEQALIEHTHGDNFVKVDSIKTLSEDVKAKIAELEALGVTATKIRRSLFKESTNGMNVPTLKQIQNYIARIRTKRIGPSIEVKPTIVRDLIDLSNKRTRGRPRRLDQQKLELADEEHKIVEQVNIVNTVQGQVNNNFNSAELDAFQKLSQLLEACQRKIKLNGEPFAKRQRQTYHFERSFPSKPEFDAWWDSKKPEGLVHNSTYSNNAGEKIDIYRCAKRDCQHRVRIVFNPVDNTVCVERSDADHDSAIHDSKTSFTRDSKAKIHELFDLGLKPKAIRIHLIQNSDNPSQIPTLTQIKNLVNRLKIKQKSSDSSTPTANISQLSFFEDVPQ